MWFAGAALLYVICNRVKYTTQVYMSFSFYNIKYKMTTWGTQSIDPSVIKLSDIPHYKTLFYVALNFVIWAKIFNAKCLSLAEYFRKF